MTSRHSPDRRHFLSLCLAGAGSLLAGPARGEDKAAAPSTGHSNVVMPTLGGVQLWADEQFFHEWHIQRNVLTGHYRLLDPANSRYAWGTLEQCRTRLEQVKREKKIPPMKGAGVICVHGILGNPYFFTEMADYLKARGGYAVFRVAYPSSQDTIADHAASLARIIDSLDGIEEINLVAHSMGNLVVRHYLGDHTHRQRKIRPDARLHRMVMLGPPNQGAELAEALGKGGLLAKVSTTADQLGRQFGDLERHLGTPEFPFGILAGGRGNDIGYNPLVTKDDDLIVSVESTKLPGAADFQIVPVNHVCMMNEKVVQERTLRFLKHGYFTTETDRSPLPVSEPKKTARK